MALKARISRGKVVTHQVQVEDARKNKIFVPKALKLGNLDGKETVDLVS